MQPIASTEGRRLEGVVTHTGERHHGLPSITELQSPWDGSRFSTVTIAVSAENGQRMLTCEFRMISQLQTNRCFLVGLFLDILLDQASLGNILIYQVDIYEKRLSSCYCRCQFLWDPSPIIGNACHSLTDSLTHWLTNSCLVNYLMWSWRVKMPIQNLLRLLMLLMLMLRIMLATVCYRFGSWGLVIKLNFCSDFEQWALCSRFWSWSSGEILKLQFGQYFAADVL